MAARSLYLRRNPDVDIDSLIIYTTTQTHSLGAKAGLVLGLKCRALEVTFEDRFALRVDALQKALAEDQKAGKHPFIFSACFNSDDAGRVVQTYRSRYSRNYIFRRYRSPRRNSSFRYAFSNLISAIGSIISPVKEQTKLWLHVDAAWAGVALACPEFRELSYLEYINRYADSVCTNFHKVEEVFAFYYYCLAKLSLVGLS